MSVTRIVALAARGDGVTEDGRHVALAAPGDAIDASGALIRGEHHVVPPCRHFPECGGCQLQHVDDFAYAAYLASRVEHALAAQGVTEVAAGPVHLSPPRTRRRATMRAERRGGRVALGFNVARSNAILDLRECHVLLPELFALVAPLRSLLGALLPDRARAEVALTRVDQGVDLLIRGAEAPDLAAVEALSEFAARHRLARLSFDEGYGATTRYEPTPVSVTLGGMSVGFPAAGFLQATADGEAVLREAVAEAIDGADAVVDLFAGLGTFALPLGATLAVEGSAAAAAALAATRRVAVAHRDLFRRPLAPAELDRFDAAVLDPPRAGAAEQIAALAASTVPRIAYVSCNTATFARDARTLIAGGYRLLRVQPVGQFRWSTHVELVAAFTR